MGGRKRWYAPALIAIGALAALGARLPPSSFQHVRELTTFSVGCIIFLTTQISPNKVLNEFMTVACVALLSPLALPCRLTACSLAQHRHVRLDRTLAARR